MSWPIAAAANLIIAGCYFAISWFILGGLLRTRQLRSNPLGSATALIFLTCAVHHGSHAVHLLLPLVTPDAHGEAMRRAFGWQMSVWDVLGAAVGVLYLSLRSSYSQLLQTPQMFDDLAQARAELTLVAEHEALEEAQALARIGSFLRRQDGEWTTSPEYRRIMELADEEDPELAWTRVHPDDLERVRAAVARARAGEPQETSYRLTRRDGSLVHLQLRVRPDPDVDGSVPAISGTVQDITAHAELEGALRNAEQRFRTAFEAAPIGVSLISLAAASRGQLVAVNPALGTMLGQTAPQLEGRTLQDLTHPDDLHLLLEAVGPLRGHATAEAELRLLHRDGRPLWVVLSAAPLPDHDELAVVNVMDVSQRKQFEGRLQHLADHDALTGLFNRRRFTEELERTLLHSARYGEAGAVLFLDLDGFKFVNDSLGHAAGDQLIARVGELLGSAVRGTDVVARVGGDEFAILLTRGDHDAAVQVAENVLQVVRDDGQVGGDARHRQVSASVGIALFAQDDDLTADELLVEADIAMYDAKEAGKDRLSVYDRRHDQRRLMSVRENWNLRLRHAVDHDAFVLHAQPIVELHGAGGPPTFELLLRLPDANGDLIAPGAFLASAERFGLITSIDRWVLGQAVRHVHDSLRAGHDLRLTVNVSGRSMSDPHLGTHVAELLTRLPIPRDRLVIEITETAAITNIERARALSRELRELGCQIALDDFGAGFASFYYLKHLQVDYLKIDGEFIRNLCRNPTDQLVVQAVVGIAGGMGTRTVAEFVGDDATIESLAALGVDAGQGFHLGRPAALIERLAYLRLQTVPAAR
ncbi:MAG: domain S-box protein [Solirubrobacterales bacterium]|nr:domain S-box protein [Solirubrobacterales bacterium]